MKIIALFFCGVILWPILEYTLHRFSGHEYGIPRIFYLEHSTHHQKHHYFAPAWKKALAAFGVLAALTVLNSLWLEISSALVFSSGVVSMYLFYEWMHYSFHTSAPKTKMGLKLRKHHFAHHFHHPKYNHGVTTDWLDYLFGTHRKVDVVKIPQSFAMSWLLDHSGMIHPEWGAHFQIKTSTKTSTSQYHDTQHPA